MKTVVGLIDTYKEAEDLIQDLVNNGFNRDSISYLVHRDQVEGAGLAGSASLAVPGIGPIYSGGPISSSLTGGGKAKTEGTLIKALTNMGLPEEHANFYAEGVRRGGTLVTVGTDDDSAQLAADIMSRHGAVDIDRRSEEWKKAGWRGFDEKAVPYTAQMREREAVLPVVEEEVKIGKRGVAKGGVHVYSHVTETPIEEKVTLREERAKVERRPVDRPVTAGDEAFREKSYEIKETGEEPVVSKQARVKEEVVVGKEAFERTETIHETAKRTDVEVEEDQDFRSHFKSNYATFGDEYETYDPAYRYAGTISRDPRYMNRDWTQIEGNIRKDWEKEHPGTWDKFKGSIRYGWEKMRGRRKKAA